MLKKWWCVIPIGVSLLMVVVICALLLGQKSRREISAAGNAEMITSEAIEDAKEKKSITLEESDPLEEQAANASVNTQVQEITELEEAINTINEYVTGE